MSLGKRETERRRQERGKEEKGERGGGGGGVSERRVSLRLHGCVFAVNACSNRC